MAPEIILDKRLGYGYHQLFDIKKTEYSKESDVWSFGIVIYEFLCRCYPYSGSNIINYILFIINIYCHMYFVF